MISSLHADFDIIPRSTGLVGYGIQSLDFMFSACLSALAGARETLCLAFLVSLTGSADYLQESQFTHTQTATGSAASLVRHHKPPHQAFQTGPIFTQALVASTLVQPASNSNLLRPSSAPAQSTLTGSLAQAIKMLIFRPQVTKDITLL